MSGEWNPWARLVSLGRPLRRVGIVLPFLGPSAAHELYQPINANWTVKRFGCGCPPLDGHGRFNANDFNLVLWGVVAIACVVTWVLALRRAFPARGPSAFSLLLMGGIILILWLCSGYWAKGVWL